MISTGIGIPLGLALGVVMARRKGGLWDKLGTVYVVLIQAIPLAIIYLFIKLYGPQLFNMSIL